MKRPFDICYEVLAGFQDPLRPVCIEIEQNARAHLEKN